MHVLCVLGTLVLYIRIQLTIHPLSPLPSPLSPLSLGLVDGLQDRLLFPSLYGITLNVTELGDGNRSIVLSGEATPQVYEQVSVYMHLLLKCFVYTINACILHCIHACICILPYFARCVYARKIVHANYMHVCPLLMNIHKLYLGPCR